MANIADLKAKVEGKKDTTTAVAATSETLTHEEFVRRAIVNLRKGDYKGIHTVFSGFNEAFKKHYGTDPIEATNKLAAEGKINVRPVKGGVMLFLPEDAKSYSNKGEVALNQILNGPK